MVWIFSLAFSVVISGFPTLDTDPPCVEITLDEVAEIAVEHSPYYAELVETREITSFGLDAGLQWSNPSLNYDLEYLERTGVQEAQHHLFLEQTIERPGLYQSRRRSANLRQESANAQFEADRRVLFSMLRGEYIQLRLLEEQLATQQQLIDRIERVADAARAQASAGELSPLDRQLIELSRQSITNTLTESKISYEQRLSEWKQQMGFDANSSVRLTSEISVAHVEFPDSTLISSTIHEHPLLAAADHTSQAASEDIRAEERRRLPAVDVRAGYTRMNPDWNGFLFGVSIPLPLLHQNQSAIEQSRAELRRSDIRLTREQQALESQFQHVWTALTLYGDELSSADTELHDVETLGAVIQSGYREGSLSLTEALSALELASSGYSSYLMQFAGWYDALATLEDLSGLTLLE